MYEVEKERINYNEQKGIERREKNMEKANSKKVVRGRQAYHLHSTFFLCFPCA